MLIWRFLTYYFVLFYGLVDYIIFDRMTSKFLKQQQLIESQKLIAENENENIEESEILENNSIDEIKQ